MTNQHPCTIVEYYIVASDPDGRWSELVYVQEPSKGKAQYQPTGKIFEGAHNLNDAQAEARRLNAISKDQVNHPST